MFLYDFTFTIGIGIAPLVRFLIYQPLLVSEFVAIFYSFYQSTFPATMFLPVNDAL